MLHPNEIKQGDSHIQMTDFLQHFKTIPQYGILAFVSEVDKSIYMFFSQTAMSIFCTHMIKLKQGIHDNTSLQHAFNQNLLQLKVIKSYESDPGSIALRADYELLISEHMLLGYKDMRNGFKAIGYKIKKYILNDFRSDVSSLPPLVYVCGRSLSLGEVVLGVFDSIPSADEWLNSTYGSKRNDVLPTFVDSDLTREYHKANGYKICRL